MSTPQFWLSFADASLPKGQQFLGAAIVNAHSFLEAVKVAHILDINPGGEVQGHEVEVPSGKEIPAQYVERLLNREEIAELEEAVS